MNEYHHIEIIPGRRLCGPKRSAVCAVCEQKIALPVDIKVQLYPDDSGNRFKIWPFPDLCSECAKKLGEALVKYSKSKYIIRYCEGCEDYDTDRCKLDNCDKPEVYDARVKR